MLFSIITPTHNPKWLAETWASLREQTCGDFEWVICPNGGSLVTADVQVQVAAFNDPRIRVEPLLSSVKSIGAIKCTSFMHGNGDVLVELDHDDLLASNALAELATAVQLHPEAGFFFSDSADFDSGAPQGQGFPVTYMTNMRPGWEANGIKFYDADIAGTTRPGRYTCVSAFEATAKSLSMIYWAPNHVRAWRRSVYRELGGHDPTFDVCDDHELLVRTYLHTRMHRISLPLYLYRVSGQNSWAGRADRIRQLSIQICADNLEKLVAREAQLRGLPNYDLGGAIGCPSDWQSVDLHDAAVVTDLTQRWPWADSSVFAFRAHDLLEHLPDKQHTMREIHRCLVPGGWLLSSTPSTDGRGAFQDPTHVSFWNQNSFWYWTRREQANYIRNTDVRFQPARLFTHTPSEWHRENDIPYVVANLVALKPGYEGPGENFI